MCLPESERDMALEAVLYTNNNIQQPLPSSSYAINDTNNKDLDFFNFNNDTGLHYLLSPPPPPPEETETTMDTTSTCSERPKRRRGKTRKNKEEIENQRMTHIAVERNRRKQMNDYLSLLRNLMPDSYVQRGDQASIIGGAINYVKVLEQKLQFLAATTSDEDGGSDHTNNKIGTMPFSEFFGFPQVTGNADIEVTMVESHANLKIRSKKKPKQLLKMVSNLQAMRLTILHLNVTTTNNDIVLYSLSVKVEDDCKLESVDEIATAVCQMMENIQHESVE
ncbi:transcription factor bHLH96 [Arachis duranensis]|uniref:Transcription factor bHLH96 n=1 Tax=Arachis duranensis TaxID=130453 RepID=A0A6P4DHW2_ARADU|nr:transcription factor bHLH96 [Arachis duranensis]